MLLMRAKGQDVDKAIALYELVLKSKPENSGALYNLGRALVLKGDLEKARKALTEAARLSPEAAAPRLMLAGLSLRDREPDGALRHALDALARAPADPRASFLKSTALMELARYDEAQVELDKLAQRFPQSRDVQIQQGLLAILAKNYSEAERIFARLTASVPGDPRAVSGLAETYSAQRQFERAIRFLESEKRKTPESDILQRLIASTAARAGQYDRAILEYEALLKKYPRASVVLMGLGDAYREKGDVSVAVGHFTKAVEISPQEPVLHLLLGFALQQSGRQAEAKDAYRKVLALDSKNGIAMNNLAYLLSSGSAKELDEALELAKRAVSGNGNPTDSRDTLGWIYLKKGMPDSAAQIFESIVRDNPENSTIQYHLGLARIDRNDPAGARQALLAALAARPGEAEAGEIRAALTRVRRE
jgi:tetratricopeptide (TPR) repeat protein